MSAADDDLDTAGGGIMGRRRRAPKPAATADGATSAAGETDEKKSTAGSKSQVAIMKMAKDIAELELPSSVKLVADKKDNYLKFSLVVSPTDGYWAGATYEFKFQIPDEYPWATPVVTCVDPIWHPNIDMQGKPCVNVLQKNWKPTFTIQTIVFGILFLFSDPNPMDPLNNDAAEEMRSDLNKFKRNVLTSLRGGYVGSHKFSQAKGDTKLFGTKFPK